MRSRVLIVGGILKRRQMIVTQWFCTVLIVLCATFHIYLPFKWTVSLLAEDELVRSHLRKLDVPVKVTQNVGPIQVLPARTLSSMYQQLGKQQNWNGTIAELIVVQCQNRSKVLTLYPHGDTKPNFHRW